MSTAKRCEARFIFTRVGEEARAGVTSADDLIGQVVIDSPTDSKLRNAVHSMIVADDALLERVKTHSVVADVGEAKDSGGLGASHPSERIILFKPTE